VLADATVVTDERHRGVWEFLVIPGTSLVFGSFNIPMPHFAGLASSFPSSGSSTDEPREKRGRGRSEGAGLGRLPCGVSSAAMLAPKKVYEIKGSSSVRSTPRGKKNKEEE
jgi:hypothetical protein